MSEAQKIRKRRQRKLTRSKRRKEAALKKELVKLKKQLVESRNNDSRSSYDSNSEKDPMDFDSTKDTKTFQNSNAGVEDVDDLNEEPETYVVDINNTTNNDSRRVRTIDEAASSVSSVTDHYSNVNNVKSLNERNQRRINSSSISSSSKSSSSNSECLYDVRDCWDACNKRNDHGVAVDSLVYKLTNTHINQHDVLESESLSLGIQSLKNMYDVEMTNPMVLAKWNFWNSTPYIVTRNYINSNLKINLIIKY